MSFRDLFSDASAAYREARPTYPAALFEWLSGACRGHELAWDCGCGNGQATVPLASHFANVIGTDASGQQLAEAEKHDRVRYVEARAENSGLDDSSVDLCTVAQAAHWFDHDSFYREVRRVLNPGGMLAYITYGVHSVSPEIDEIVGRFYVDIVGPYWPPERRHIDEKYVNLPFPFERITGPVIEFAQVWNLRRLVAYLETWSATKRYRSEHGTDPIEQIWASMAEAWGEIETKRKVTWPLTVVAGYND